RRDRIEWMAAEPTVPPEPRWPAFMALLATGGLLWALPSTLSVGPDWSVLALVAILDLPAFVSYRQGLRRMSQAFGYSASSVVTLATITSLSLLIARLPGHKETPAQLLVAAAALWGCNVLTFACWYWRLDAGGPYCRDIQGVHTDGAFLFPQMTLSREVRREM